MRVDDYEFGKIDIAGRHYTSDVIISPETVKDAWWRKTGHRLHVEDLHDVVRANPDVLVVGTGYYGKMVVLDETKVYLQTKGIEVRAMRTGEAVKEFNRLQQNYARIVAALHLTC